jgi:hypothetical protein
MPVIAVAGAVAGASALAAGGLTIWGTISAIGGIIGGIGALTGNEDMMKIGGIAGLAGGIGGFASGKGWLAADATAAAGDGGNIGAMLDAPAPGMENVNPTDMRLAAGTQSTPMEASGLADAGSTANMGSGLTQNITQTNSLVSDAPKGLIDSANPTSPASTALAGPGDPGWGADLGKDPVASLTKPGEGGIFGSLKKFSSFLNENKELTSMAGNFIGGMFDDRKKAETELLEARAATERQQLLNGSAIPNMNLRLKPQATIFRPGTPTYNAPRPGSLFYAK